MKYRADIDGLRAVAIVLVLVFHTFPHALPGGFIGVDLFFVISGYLISGILLTSGYSGFYRRRIVRIFPALVCALAVTLALGYALLGPTEFASLGRHVQATTTFVQNNRLSGEVGYFDAASEGKPLLHLWSLSVEEQFYIAWPLLLLGLRRWVQPVWVVLAALALSAVYCLVIAQDDPSKAFYRTFSRAWELLAGALCFVALDRWRTRWTGVASLVAGYVAAAGLLATLMVALTYRPDWPHPGPLTAVPVLAALLLIAAGPQAPINRLLSHPWAVYIGKISYPLYLYHWPALVFGYLVFAGEPPVAVKVGGVLLATTLAVLTYHGLERPMQRRAVQARWSVALVLAACGLWAAGGWVHRGDGLPERGIAQHNGGLEAPRHWAGQDLTNGDCNIQEADRAVMPMCASDKREQPTHAVWGDSKGEALYWGLVRASSPGRRWMMIGLYSCAPLLGVERVKSYASVQPESCVASNRAALQALTSNEHVTHVLLTTAARVLMNAEYRVSSTGQALPEAAALGLSHTIVALQAAGKKVALMVDSPDAGSPELCMDRVGHLFDWPIVQQTLHARCGVALSDHLRKTARYRAILEQMRRQHGVLIIDPTNRLCDVQAGRCTVRLGGRLLYGNTDHYSDVGNTLAAQEIIQSLQAAP